MPIYKAKFLDLDFEMGIGLIFNDQREGFLKNYTPVLNEFLSSRKWKVYNLSNDELLVTNSNSMLDSLYGYTIKSVDFRLFRTRIRTAPRTQKKSKHPIISVIYDNIKTKKILNELSILNTIELKVSRYTLFDLGRNDWLVDRGEESESFSSLDDISEIYVLRSPIKDSISVTRLLKTLPVFYINDFHVQVLAPSQINTLSKNNSIRIFSDESFDGAEKTLLLENGQIIENNPYGIIPECGFLYSNKGEYKKFKEVRINQIEREPSNELFIKEMRIDKTSRLKLAVNNISRILSMDLRTLDESYDSLKEIDEELSKFLPWQGLYFDIELFLSIYTAYVFTLESEDDWDMAISEKSSFINVLLVNSSNKKFDVLALLQDEFSGKYLEEIPFDWSPRCERVYLTLSSLTNLKKFPSS